MWKNFHYRFFALLVYSTYCVCIEQSQTKQERKNYVPKQREKLSRANFIAIFRKDKVDCDVSKFNNILIKLSADGAQLESTWGIESKHEEDKRKITKIQLRSDNRGEEKKIMNVGAKSEAGPSPSAWDQLAANNNNNSNNHPTPPIPQPTSPVVKQPNDTTRPPAEFINEELHPELVSR